MIHYKKALLELKKNKIKIYSEKVSAEDSINRISSVNINEEKFDKFLNINTKKDLEKAKENLDKI